MSEQQGPRLERVRVTSPYAERPRVRPRTNVAGEIDAQSEVGALYVSALLRSQLRQAVGTLTALALTIGMLPLVFTAFPALSEKHVFGMPVSWVLLAFGCYPVLIALAWRHLRASERNEDEFVQVVQRS